MTMTRKVNGETVNVPAAEEAEIRAEWARMEPTAEEVLAQARAAAVAELVAETERKRLQVIHDAVAVDFKDAKNVKDVSDKLKELKEAKEPKEPK